VRYQLKKTFIIFICLLSLVFTAYAAPLSVGFIMANGGLGDQSFNDITYAGLIKAKKELHIRLFLEEPKSHKPHDLNVSFERLIAKKPDLIVANGWHVIDVVTHYSKQHPKQFFLVNDAPIDNLPNVASNVYGQHEGSFLAGALAGWMTRTNKIGFIGGLDDPVIQSFKTGYMEGARYANPKIRVSVNFVKTGNDYSGFIQPEKGKQLAVAQYNQGIDIIFSAAGMTGNGIIWAAQKEKKWVIGVDSDQDHMARGHVLTSMMKRLDHSTYYQISQYMKNKFQPGIHYFGLKEKGVSLSPMKYTQHIISKDIQKRLKMIEAKIISRDINVTNYLKNTK